MSAPPLLHATAQLRDVRLHYVTCGFTDQTTQAVMLLHGWPQSWYEWRHVMPELAEDHAVIAVDLRGLGDSSKPVAGYDKMTLAADLTELAGQLGLTQIAVVGHDWGGAVAAALALQQRQLVTHLAMLDIVLPGIPLPGMGEGLGGYWHMQFHQVMDLPEALVTGREETYIRWFFSNFAHNPAAITPDDVAEYVRCLQQPGALRSGFGYYRAMGDDAVAFAEAAKTPLVCPVLALGGAQSIGAGVKLCAEQFASDVRGGVIENCGHWIPEEKPAELLAELRPFLAL